HQLITNGPFAVVRHPMYLGVVLASIGCLLMYATWTTLLLCTLAPILIRRARREEVVLAQEFGAQWLEYCQRVPAFLPRLNPTKGHGRS
ncbi:MAG: isoprenylcysteine carboxylmethyltransferase family protein, partial [Anaerolineae bacterium]|nr:isoprenylcysteine carboxylmethyltransferase family protein [Anaerolineae bacterium]